MPFSYRKSVSLGSGVRMTFSKSGVSTSVGGKGYRVTAGPRGTYVTVGGRGIHYRQKIGGYVGQSPVPVVAPTQTPNYHQPAPTFQTGTAIPTADASQLVELSSAATLEQLNTVSKQPAYAWMFVVGGGIVGLLLAQIHFVLFVLTFGLALYVASIANKSDKERRTFHLEYQLDAKAQQRWDLLCQSLSALGRTQRIWRITTQDRNYDWKRNAGASSILTRTGASVQQKTSSTIATNVSPVCLDIGGQQFYFLPERVYVLQNKLYGAVEYASMIIGVGTTRFIEEQGVPSDSQVVGQTWRFVNKSGGPDRRFNNNIQIPIAQYGVAELKSGTGLNILLHVSSVAAAEQFVNLFQSFQGYRQQPPPPPQGGYEQHQNQQPPNEPPRTSQRRRTATPKPPEPAPANCYQILGLSPSCTKEEASTKYRQQAMQYHPDRVNHLAPEFQELATKKIKELNLAYEEVKRLRGW